MKKYPIILIVLIVAVLTSCSEYQKLLKTNDPELKYNKMIQALYLIRRVLIFFGDRSESKLIPRMPVLINAARDNFRLNEDMDTTMIHELCFRAARGNYTRSLAMYHRFWFFLDPDYMIPEDPEVVSTPSEKGTDDQTNAHLVDQPNKILTPHNIGEVVETLVQAVNEVHLTTDNVG